jgi:hypothetical protein
MIDQGEVRAMALVRHLSSVSTPRPAPSTPFAMALGGGGAYGIAFHLGVTHALLEAGIPVDRGPMVGISAGSYAGAALATGTDLKAIMDAWRWYARTRQGRRARTHDITSRLFGDARDARVNSVCTPGLSPVPVLVRGSQHPLADVVAAASSPLGLAHGHRLGDRVLYDAGYYWNTGANHAPAANVLLVLAPMAAGLRRGLGTVFEARLRAEVRLWRLTHRGEAVVVRPDADVIEAGGRDMLDVACATATYRAAYAQGERLVPDLAFKARAAGLAVEAQERRRPAHV